MIIHVYEARLSTQAFQLLTLINDTPHITRADCVLKMYGNSKNGINAVGKLLQRLKRQLVRMRAPFVIRSRQWQGYWIEPTREVSPLKDVIVDGLLDDYFNSEFCNYLAGNVLASMEKAGIAIEALEGVLTGTHKLERALPTPHCKDA